MKWGLTQGAWGVRRTSYVPVTGTVGPNPYLSQTDFLKMLGVALVVHVLVIGIAALIPKDTVTDIPVRALSFKLGDADQVAAYNPLPKVSAPAPVAKPVAAPVMEATSGDDWRAATSAQTVPVALKPVVKSQPKAQPKPKPIKQPKVVKVVAPTPPAPTVQPTPAPPAIAPTPQQYVREVGGAPDGAIGGQGNETTMTEQSVQAIRSRYEQDISSWIQRHKIYPASASGREGRAIVRVRIDRAGNVRYYAIEQSAGLAALDIAALDMIRRANPVPAVPANYPAGNLVEFLIPISFKAPL